ncbi:MAG: hypothetical protein H6682_07710 [Candidatus Eisenbacteria bacterium]|nr:hypothetical protein [Candidatus Eisenbacteria bacterium]
MLPLNLTKEELEILKDVLEGSLSDLRMEIANTDRMEFREQLKERKNVIAKVIEWASAAPAATK